MPHPFPTAPPPREAALARVAKLSSGPIVPLVATPTEACVDDLNAIWHRGHTPILLSPFATASETAHVLDQVGTGAPEHALIVATSGSSGEPQLIVHSASGLRAAASRAVRALDFLPASSCLLSLPLFHVGGVSIVTRSWTAGAELQFVREGEPLLVALPRLRPSHVSLVPTQLQDALDDEAAAAALAACRVVLMGGAACVVSLRERAVAAGVPLVCSYGLTETAALIACSTTPSAIEGDAGLPLPGVDVRVSDVHELLVDTDSLFIGTHRGGAFHPRPSGPYATGDVGRIETSGSIVVEGRRDSMFISGGENVHPERIERAIATHPRVRSAVVVPISDDRLGARPVAVVDADATAEELRQHLASLVPTFFHPATWYRLPLTPGLKPRRGDIERDAAAGTLDRL